MKGTRNSDWHFQGPVFLVSSPGQRRHPCECRWGQPHRRRPGFFPATQKTPPPWRDSDAMMKCFFSFLDVMRVLFVSFSPATWLKSSKKNTIVVYSWYIYGGDLCICGIPQPKSQSMAFFFSCELTERAQDFWKMFVNSSKMVPLENSWMAGDVGVWEFFLVTQEQQQQQQQIFDSNSNVFSHSFRRVSSCQTCISYMSHLHTTYQYPWTPKPMNEKWRF